jgi:hypothetical protein
MTNPSSPDPNQLNNDDKKFGDDNKIDNEDDDLHNFQMSDIPIADIEITTCT